MKPFSLLAFFFAVALCVIAPRAAYAVCSSPSGTAGQIIYNQTQRTFAYCNDTAWVAMSPPGSGSGGCTTPTIAEGQMSYNADNRVLQGCAGNVHVAMGPIGGGALPWTKISAGLTSFDGNHTCGIKANNSLWCWGTNKYSDLGIGISGSAPEVPFGTPQKLGGSWIDVAAGSNHSCGIKTDNTLWCWGRNDEGQLGNGTTNNSSTPVQVSGGGSWKSVSAGLKSNCAIRSDDTMRCWGNNNDGQLGTGNTTQYTSPTALTATGGWNTATWKSVAMGASNACAIRTDDTIRCWGGNWVGQLGDNTTTAKSAPTALTSTGGWNTATWKAVSSGEHFTCAIRTDDTMRCWGQNGDGQLGRNNTTGVLLPSALTATGGWDTATWKSVDAGQWHVCAVRSDDTIRCWGNNSDGQIGDNSTTDRLVPTAINGGGVWQRVSGGSTYTCGITTVGAISCWGSALDGQLGNNNTFYNNVPAQELDLGPWKDVVAHGYNTCGLRTNGEFWCRFGGNTTSFTFVHAGPFKSISKGYFSSCLLRDDDTAMCYGDNWAGQLGDGTTTSSGNTPVTVSGGHRWKKITPASSATCGVRITDNTLWCWGNNSNGAYGNNTTTSSLTPVQIGSDQWLDVAGNDASMCGVKIDGSLWCWGENGNYQLGTNNTTDSLVPVQPTGSGAFTWKNVYESCAKRSDDTLWCWGDYAGSGYGTRQVPTEITTGGTWKTLEGGNGNVPRCAIKSDDTAWCWGPGFAGALGDGVFGYRHTVEMALPVQGGVKFKAISTGPTHACGIPLETSDMLCWGSAEFDRFRSKYSTAAYLTPTQIWCSTPTAAPGQVAFNTDEKQLQYCDGSGWVGAGGFGIPVGTTIAVPTSGLIAYWPFNEGAGTSAADATGNGNTGTLTNGPTWVTGKVGAYAVNFDGVNDVVDAGSAAIIDDIAQKTICAWIYPRAPLTGDNVVISKEASDGNGGFRMYSSGNGVVTFGRNWAESGADTDYSQWTHSCMTDNGTVVKLYKNGILATTYTGTGWGTFGSDAAATLRIGRSSANANHPFNGYIDEVRIYNRVLTGSEIQALAAQ
jgi:alpha-tubulin suppressor-like RCC1 family protein